LAEQLAKSAVELTRQTEAPVLQADALADLAMVLQIAGKSREAKAAIAEAVDLYGAKGDVVSAGRCRTMAEGFGPSA
jgi:hypothetical protein